jgi:hypothetical protein
MRFLLMMASLLVLVLFGGQVRGKAAPSSGTGPVVLELFTSEGCSSCPPADKLLGELERRGSVNGRQILIMGEHVDYWDELGWKDRFSSHVFTQRQTDYARRLGVGSPYTPQLVINGRTEVVGNDETAITRKISALSSTGSAVVTLGVDSSLNATVKVQGATAGSEVLLAITEDGLTTQVKRGENGGRELQHAGVVRRLTEIGTARSGILEVTVPIKLDPAWRRENLRVIVLVQNLAGGPIEGAAAAGL